MDSKTSFARFLLRAWNALQAEEAGPPAARKSVPLMLRGLYTMAAAPSAGPVKTALTPPLLYTAMAQYMTNAAGRFAPLRIRLQGQPAWDVTARLSDLVAYYRAQAASPAPPVENWQKLALAKLPGGYLHVYPATSTAGDWRIALNVVPSDMAKAMGLCRPLLEQPSAINHIKFFGPASASKCDSVLCYLKKDASYDGLRAQFLDIAGQLTLQPCVGGMWQEDARVPGFGEAAEPPKEQGLYTSFTTYRCLVVYLAYKTYTGGGGYDGFQAHLANVMAQFGLDPNQPHVQLPVPDSLAADYSSYLQLYLDYKTAWKGTP
jgi:hypothetical protein